MAASSRPQVLALYKSLLREACKFKDYNYRKYAIRRTQDGFHANKGVSDPQRITSLLEEARHSLEIIKRQVVIGQLYGEGSLVIESPKGKSHLG